MYDNILVPVVFDHGERGAKSLKVAQELLNEGGKITLMHVMEDVPAYATTYLPEGLAQRHHSEAMERLKKMAKAVQADVEVAVIHGHAYSTIIEYSKTHKADCIVIASHKPGFEDYFLGSTAASVVRHAKCGVHVLR
ncbi:MAG: universal stress protein [Roseobacter sp.]|jgi:nucleotide-binding universal stress UspA family protein